MRVQHVDGEYRVVLTPEAMAALHLTEGAAVELRQVEEQEPVSGVEYASVQDALDSYEKTEPLHRNTYRELAK